MSNAGSPRLSSSPPSGTSTHEADPTPFTVPESASTEEGTTQHGPQRIYNTLNIHHAPVTTIRHAENVRLAVDEDIALFETLPKQPDVSAHWTDYMEGSRSKDINDICTWLDKGSELVLWVHAAAGLGKSTLARQLKHHLHSQRRLAAAIFLSQLATDSLGPETIVKMIAGELGRTHRGAVPAIAAAIRQSHGASLQVLLDTYLRDPLLSLGLPDPLTVILDAIDEWRSNYYLISELGHLTSHTPLIRFVVLSRSQPTERLYKNVSIQPYPLLPVTVEVMQGYLAKRFKTIEWAFGRIPTEDEISRLAGMANGLFIWLSIVCSLLEESYSDPQRMLTSILCSRHNVGGANHQLALLYFKAIAQLFPQPEDKGMLKEFLGHSMVIQEPLSLDAFSQLSRLPVYSLKKIGVSLTALQIRRPADSGMVVHPASNLFHASFLEYLQSTSTPPDITFPVPPSTYHSKLGEACLDVLPCFLRAALKLANIHPSPAIEYVTLYWPWHISQALHSTKIGGTDHVGTKLGHSLLQGRGVLALLCMQQWARSFAGLIGVNIKEGCLGGDTVNTTLRDVARLLDAAGTSSVVFGIPCLKVAAYIAAEDAQSWYELGRAYRYQAEVDDSLEFIQCSVASFQRAVDVSEVSHAEHMHYLCSLATSLNMYSEHAGNTGDSQLQEDICLARYILSLCPSGHPEQLPSLINLANSLHTSFNVSGGADKLEEAIGLYRGALTLCPPGHPDRSMSLNNLATSLHTSFQVSGGADRLEEAIALHRDALALRPPGHPGRSMSLNNLASALQTSFWVLGGAGKLEEAIVLHRDALNLRPPGHPHRSESLNNLADDLQTSFEVSGGADKLEEAIALHREALALRPPGHPGRSMSLNNLASALQTFFGVSGGVCTLEEAIALHEEALALRPSGHPDRHMSLSNLANCQQDHFRASGNRAYLEEAIVLHRECLSHLPSGHFRRPEALYWLRLDLYDRFNTNGTIEDFHEAVALAEEELSLYPPDHRYRDQVLEWLSEHVEQNGSDESEVGD